MKHARLAIIIASFAFSTAAFAAVNAGPKKPAPAQKIETPAASKNVDSSTCTAKQNGNLNAGRTEVPPQKAEVFAEALLNKQSPPPLGTVVPAKTHL